MADEINKRDQNHITVLSGVTDDVNNEIRMLRVDPTTKRLLVSAVVAGTNNGKLRVTGADTLYDYLFAKLTAGTNITLTVLNPGGNETVKIDAANLDAYNLFKNEGVAVTQRYIINLSNLLTASDNAGTSETELTINTINLANDTTFIDNLIANDYFTTNLALSDNFIFELTNNNDFIDYLIANTYFTTNLALDMNFYTTLANNNLFIDQLISNTYFTTNLANDNNFITNLTANSTFQTLVNIFVSSGGGSNVQIDQSPDNGTYGTITGAINGINDTYTVSTGLYLSGRLQVFLNGLVQLQGATDDWVELVPGSGTFVFNTPPAIGDIITIVYQVTAVVSSQTGIQFENEGVALGTPGTVDEVDFVGAGVVATRAGDKVTVTIGGGGTGVALETAITQANAFSAGDVIRMDSTGVFMKAQADTAEHSEAVGVVTVATGTDFTYQSSAITLTYANAFTPGDGLFLSPTVAGGITNVKPSAVGQFVRALGTCLSATEIYFDIAALAEEITSGTSGATGGWYQQTLPTATVNGNDSASGSSQDGSVLYVFANANALLRYERDSNTGAYIKTHSVNPTLSGGYNNNNSIIEIGNYIYLFTTNTNILVYRFLAADLTGETNMTVPVYASTDNVMAWTDGTFAYFISTPDTTCVKWSVSGTTFSAVSTSTCQGGLNNTNSVAMYDGTTVYVVDNASSPTLRIKKLADILDSSFTETQILLEPWSDDQGGSYCASIDSNKMYVGSSYAVYNSSTSIAEYIFLLPVTKP